MMNAEKFVDTFGDDVYALALIVTKDFGSAAEIFTKVAVDCEKSTDDAGMYEIAQKAFPLCRRAVSNDKAETLAELGLSSKQEDLLSAIFSMPQIIRAFVHLFYENDLTVEQIAWITGESTRYINEQLSNLPRSLTDRLENDYKELCLNFIAADELKIKVIETVNSGEKRLFEVHEDAVPRHIWTKKQKAAAIIFAVVATTLMCVVIPLLTAYFNSFDEMNSSYDEVPSDLIFSYTPNETEHIPSE